MAARAIPLVPDGSWGAYRKVEQFLLDTDKHYPGLSYDKHYPGLSYEEIGQLARLSNDLRSDAGHLEQLAGDVDKLIDSGIDELRNRELGERRAS